MSRLTNLYPLIAILVKEMLSLREYMVLSLHFKTGVSKTLQEIEFYLPV